MSRSSKPRRDVAAEITAAILKKLEEGVMPWRRPWRTAGAAVPRRHCGTPYRGINHLFLGMKASANAYVSPYWMTLRQANALGGKVKKGETSTVTVYYGTGQRHAEDDDDEEERTYRFLKYALVFNADQIRDLPDRFHPDETALDAGGRSIERLEAFFDRMAVPVRIGGDVAAYRPGPDDIVMPPHERFEDGRRWYAVLSHEIAHYVGAENRLNRETLLRYHESRRYRAEEELVAELAAAMMGAHLGFAGDHIDDHARYIDDWMNAIGSETRLFLKAAAAAQRAVDWMFEAAGVTDMSASVQDAA